MSRADAGPQALPALTGLRFVAALAVVVSHFMANRVVPRYDAAVGFLDGGRTAVSLFFVLSGFVLALNYPSVQGRAQLRRFYVARFSRIYPMVLLALVVSTPTVLYALSAPDCLLQWYSVDSAAGPKLAASLIAQLTMLTAWFPLAAINQPWNGPAWSVSCEVFFYLLFPLLIAALAGRRLRVLAAVVLSGWAAQAAWIWGVRAVLPANRGGFVVSQFPVTHLFEFVLGICAAVWFARSGRQWLEAPGRRRMVLAVALTGIVVLSAARLSDPRYLLMSPLFALLVLGLATRPAAGGSWLAWPLLVLLGESSYALYLLHVPLMHLFDMAGVSGAAGWVAMAATIGLSVVAFRCYETPMRVVLRRRLSGSARQPSGHGPSWQGVERGPVSGRLPDRARRSG